MCEEAVFRSSDKSVGKKQLVDPKFNSPVLQRIGLLGFPEVRQNFISRNAFRYRS